MNRFLLRLSTIAALQNGGMSPWPTMAGVRVFDSLEENLNDIRAEERWPVICVLTDDDFRDNARATASVDADIDRMITMRTQLALWTAAVDEATGNVIGAGWPATTAELEAVLDLFEWQHDAALFGSGLWSIQWREQGFERMQRTSVPIFRETEEGRVKMAAREIIHQIKSKPDCLPFPIRIGDTVPTPALPKDLTDFFSYIDANGSAPFKAYVAKLREVLEAREPPAHPIYPPLFSARMFIREPHTPAGQQPKIDQEVITLGPLPTPP